MGSNITTKSQTKQSQHDTHIVVEYMSETKKNVQRMGRPTANANGIIILLVKSVNRQTIQQSSIISDAKNMADETCSCDRD